MSFQTAQRLASKMAQKGDIDGITKLLNKLRADKMEPGFIHLLTTYYEAAALNIGRKKSPPSPWYLQ